MMGTYKVKMEANGEIALPAELRDALGLMPGDYLEIKVDPEGKLSLYTAERSVGPLSDFFEDLVLSDLQREGYSGDALRSKYLERKVQLSAVFDRLAKEAFLGLNQGQMLWWREIPLLDFGQVDPENGWKVYFTSRAERNLLKLPERVLRELPQILVKLEHDPLEFKRLSGPYFEIHRVSFASEMLKHHRVIYAVFSDKRAVAILIVGERKEIYEFVKGMAL